MKKLCRILGSRFKSVHAFGLVIFEIMGIRKKDQGKYTCSAQNKAGKAESSFDLKYSNQKEKFAPTFTTQLKVNCSLNDWLMKLFNTKNNILSKDVLKLKDGMSAHFECRVTPANDPNLRIEWKFNGTPLNSSSRIKET